MKVDRVNKRAATCGACRKPLKLRSPAWVLQCDGERYFWCFDCVPEERPSDENSRSENQRDHRSVLALGGDADRPLLRYLDSLCGAVGV